MRDMGLATVAYFYLDFRDRAKQTARGLLSSLLDQLCTQANHFYDTFSSLCSKLDDQGLPPSDNDLTECLIHMLREPEQRPVYIVVDALDACSGAPRAQVLLIMKVLVGLGSPHLRICITSRPELDISDILEPLKPVCISLHDDERQHEDIAQYVKSVVYSDAKAREWSDEDKKLVIDTLANNSGGS
jgi:hypothetical protein